MKYNLCKADWELYFTRDCRDDSIFAKYWVLLKIDPLMKDLHLGEVEC